MVRVRWDVDGTEGSEHRQGTTSRTRRVPVCDDVYRSVPFLVGALNAGKKGAARIRLPEKAVVNVADHDVDKEPHRRSADVLEEGMLRRHAERRGEAVQSLEVASSVATDAHRDCGPSAATLASVLGTEKNVVGSISRGARAAQGAAGSKVWEDPTEVAASRDKHTRNTATDDLDGTVALEGLVREGRRIVWLLFELGCGWCGRTPVGKKTQEVAMKTSSK